MDVVRLAWLALVALALGTVCSGPAPAPPAAPSPAAASGDSPVGKNRTTIASWTDPRPTEWAARYPLFGPVSRGDGSLKRVQDAGNITVCAQTGINPIAYVDPRTNLVVGAEPDMMAEVAKRLGIKAFTYRRILFTAQVPQLVARQCDVYVSGVTAFTFRARWPEVKFTAPYRLNDPVVVVAAGSAYQRAADLTGKSIAGWAGSDSLDYAGQLAKTLGGGTKVLELPDEAAVYAALNSGAAAAYMDNIYNIPPAESVYKVRALPDRLRFVPAGLPSEESDENPYNYGALAALTRAGDGDLNLALSVAFQELIDDGTLRKILKKWHVDSPAALEVIRPPAK